MTSTTKAIKSPKMKRKGGFIENWVKRRIGITPETIVNEDIWKYKTLSPATRLVMKISEWMHAFYELGATGPNAYIDITGFNDAFSLTTKRNGLVGAIEIKGQYQMMEADRFVEMVDHLERRWEAMLKVEGIMLDVVFMGGDKRLIRKQLMDSISPNLATSKRFGLNLERVLESKVDKLMEYCAYEKAFLCVWVDQSVLSGQERKRAAEEISQKREKLQLAGNQSADVAGVSKTIQAAHQSAIMQITKDLSSIGIINTVVTAAEVLTDIRLMTEPKTTAFGWEPATPANYFVRTKTTSQPQDKSHLLPPSIDSQLFPNGVGDLVDTASIVNYGGKIHSSVIVTRPCLTPTHFQELFDSLRGAQIPYRIRFSIEGDALSSTQVKAKQFMVRATAWSDAGGMSSAAIRDAMTTIRNLRREDQAIVGLTIIADTWVDLEGEDEESIQAARSDLGLNIEKLNKALQAWGSMDTAICKGDALYSSLASYPGLTRKIPGDMACAPLKDVLVLLPFFRPARYWETGGMLLRSADGKIVPYEPVSSKQKAWGEIIIAPQRFGKSFWQQARNMALWTAKGITHLPYIMTLDVGPSSAGFVNLAKYSLPPELRHLAVHRQLSNTKQDAINPFDTQLGARYPTSSKYGFLQNFVLVLLANEKLENQEGMSGLVLKAVEAVYNKRSDAESPSVYQPNLLPEVDDYIAHRNIEMRDGTRLTWWRLVDYLFDAGETHLATMAQRYAVPTLKEFAIAASSNEIDAIFKKIQVSTRETAPEYFRRTVAEIVDKYPILAGPTQFDVGEARVAALDLAKVTKDDISAEGRRQACVMYLLGREALFGRLQVDDSDVERFPEQYRQHHLARIRELKETTKSLNYDEVHRISGQPEVVKVLQRDIREGPKYRVVTSLATQQITDIDQTMIDLAPNRILLGVGNPAEAERVQKLIGLSDEATKALANIRRAGKDGSTALYVLQIDEAPGYVVMPLMLSLGPEEVWAYSTTNEDDALRQRCYQISGDVSYSLAQLAKFFPETTVTTYLEALREATRSGESIDFIDDIAQGLMNGQFDRVGYLKQIRYNSRG